MKARVLIRLKPGILDPQGGTVQRSLQGLGFADLTAVRIGKVVDIELEAPDAAEARRRVGDMCARLLANPVTEDFSIEILP